MAQIWAMRSAAPPGAPRRCPSSRRVFAPAYLQRLAAPESGARSIDHDGVLAEADTVQVRVIAIALQRSQRLIAFNLAAVLIGDRDAAARAGLQPVLTGTPSARALSC